MVRPGRYSLVSGIGWKKGEPGVLRTDIQWWHTWIAEWNGTSLLWSCTSVQPDEEVWSDASGSWGVWFPLGTRMVPTDVDHFSE